MRARWRFYVISSALLLLAIVSIPILAFKEKQFQGSDVFKAIVGLVISAGITGIASLVLNEFKDHQERREAIRTRLRGTLADVVAVYNEVKSVRRLLRAQAIRPNYSAPDACVLRDPYAALLQRLNDVQLRLESHVRLIEGNKDQYPDAKRLVTLLGDAESYLGDVISEWEERNGLFRDDPHQNKLEEFRAMRCFVSGAKQGFKPGFAVHIAEVFSILDRAIGS